MKLATRDIPGFLTSPPPSVRAVLIYGPDPGLVAERRDTLAKTVTADLSDPFLSVDIDWDDLAKDPARLADEAAAIAMTGGRRVVRVRGAGESASRFFADFLSGGVPGDALILVTAGELRKSGKLVKAFEADDCAAALPCYADEGRDQAQIVSDAMKAQGSSISPDALALFTSHLGGNRAVTRQEVEKLCLYVGPNGTATPEDVAAVMSDGAAFALDTIAMATTGGQTDLLDSATATAFREGASPIALLRAVSNHLMRLHQARKAVDRGQPAADAMKGLRPPVFFKQAQDFQNQLRHWTGSALATALEIVADTETRTKRTGPPPEILCGRALHQIAAMARRGRG
ncbi:MAG: DNA polymerase III subunit delta [Alphaproteobacteria bacterium]